MATDDINLVDYNETTAFWSFLIYCLVVIFAAVFFLFYFSRIVAQIFSKILRVYTWRKYRAYVDFESLQIAPLGGRILFKNFRYKSTNQSISILHGYITFRYWLWNVRNENDEIPEDLPAFSDMTMNVKDNCRITCNLSGLEWYIYNRTPAYDILASTLGLNPDSSPFEDTMSTSDANSIPVSVNVGEDAEDFLTKDSWFRQILPIKVVCETGAIIMGNAHLPSLLVATFPTAYGMYATTKAQSKLDYYATVLLGTFMTPSIDFRPNVDYNTGIKGRNMGSTVPDISKLPPSKPGRIKRALEPMASLWRRTFGSSKQTLEEWHGLPRYQPSSQAATKDDVFTEYAMVRNVLQCNELWIRYYTDVAGKVPEPSVAIEASDDMPPQWGIDLTIGGAVISYGPWADRQRSEIQNFFYPNSYRDMEPSVEPKPGYERVHEALQMMVTFSTPVTIKIPTKEKSKDWKYADEEYQPVQGGKSMRPYGWLELKAQAGSFISVNVPMVYDLNGYKNMVQIDFQKVEMTSSVNYAPLIDLKDLKMNCMLQNPLIWNAQRDWDFNVTLDTSNILLLRDHITLIQDLSRDWSSGPPVEMNFFVPFKYEFSISLLKFQLNLYVNEHNIINEPTEAEENAFIIASGDTLEAKVVLPFVYFEPEQTVISFNMDILKGELELQLPLAHTSGEFMTSDSRKFASIPSVAISGTYSYYDFVDPSHLEALNMDVEGSDVTVKLFGNVIRYVLILVDNYLGLYLNFVTMEEYRSRRIDKAFTEEQERLQAQAKPKSDPFEVYIRLLMKNTTLMLPENLFRSDNYSQITCDELQLDMRNLDLYMDMHVNVSPLIWTRPLNSDQLQSRAKSLRGSQNYLYIDGITVYAHRLFGPLPKTTTYVANWTLDIGSVYGQIKPSFLLGVASFGMAFAYNLKDGDNAFPPEYATVTPPDITFVKLSIKEVDISIWGADVVTQILLKDGAQVQFDDVINERYMGRVVLRLPSLVLRSMTLTHQNNESQPPTDSNGKIDPDSAAWVELASLNTAFDVTVYQGAGNWREKREKQQEFIREQDRETRRCPYIYARKSQRRDSEDAQLHPDLRGNHFGTLYVPPLTTDPEAMEEKRSDSGSFIDNGSSYAGSMIEYSGGDGEEEGVSRHGSVRKTLYRSSSSFSIARSAVSEASISDQSSYEDEELGWFRGDDGDDDEALRSVQSEESLDTGSDYTDYAKPEGPQVLSDVEDEIPVAPTRSIPYSSYLKRYNISSTSAGPLYRSNPFLPPPRIHFTQSQLESGDEPRFHGHQRSSGTAFEFDELDQDSVPHGGNLGSAFSSTFTSSSAQPKVQGSDSDEKRTTIIIDATEDVKLLFTPILLKIVQEFLEAINAEEWDLETMLDVTQMEYVELLTRMQPSKLHSQQFVLNVPRVHLRFIQDVMMPDALNVLDDINVIKTRYELSGSNFCAVDIVLDAIALVAAVKYEDEEFEKFVPGKIHIASFKVVESRVNLDFSKFKLNARFVSNSTSRIFGIPDARHRFSELGISHLSYIEEPVIADITFEKFKLRLIRSSNPNFFSAELDQLSVILISQSAEIIAGAIGSWLTFVKDLKLILNRFQLRRAKQLQTLFSEIALFSDQKAINSDPVFLTRPSTTLRLGTMIYRNDDGWKLLAHIRYCMRLMPSAITDALQESLKKPELESFSTDTMYEIVIRVFSKWRSWEMDNLERCRLFTDVFEKKPVNERKSFSTTSLTESPPLPRQSNMKSKESWIYEILRYSENAVQLRMGVFEAAVYDEQHENSVRVTDLELIGESQFKPDALVAGASGTAPGQPSAATPGAAAGRGKGANASGFPGSTLDPESNRLSTGFLDIVGKTGFGHAQITANPFIIAFTRHMLRVERIFTPHFNSILGLSTEKSQAQAQPAASVPPSTNRGKLVVPRMSADGPTSPRQSIQMSREAAFQPVPTEKEDPLMSAINKFDIVFNGMVEVETITFALNAQKLSGKIIVSQIQASALNFARQHTPATSTHQDLDAISVARSGGSNPESRKSTANRLLASLVANVSSINSSLMEQSFSKDGKLVNKDLLKFSIVGLNSEVSLSQFTPPKRPKQTKSRTTREAVNVLVTFRRVTLSLPRSILKLYMFAKDWREENMKSIDFLFQGVMDEWEADRRVKAEPKVMATPPTPRELKVQLVLQAFSLELHMLPSLQFQYEAGDLMVMIHDLPAGIPFTAPKLTYKLQLLRQSVDFIANRKTKGSGSNGRERANQKTNESHHAANFALPIIRSTGSISTVAEPTLIARKSRRGSITSAMSRSIGQVKQLEADVSVDFVQVTLNVNMLDHILTAQSLLGAELTELVDILAKDSKGTPTPATTAPVNANTNEAEDAGMLYSVQVSLVGLSISAFSPTAALFFESDVLKAIITNNHKISENMTTTAAAAPSTPGVSASASASAASGPNSAAPGSIPSNKRKLVWRVSAQNITLSLSHHNQANTMRQTPRPEGVLARKLRLAYFTIQLVIQNYNPAAPEKERFAHTKVSSFYVSFTKAHALMQPQAVGRIINLYTFYSHELERRREMKASDMAKLADNTKRIIKSLEVDVPSYNKENTRSMLESTEIYLRLEDVAIAIPLDRREDIMDSNERQVEAFLITATSISILTKSGETSSGDLKSLCVQFVPNFEQTRDEHFRSKSHPRMNRLEFPNLSVTVEAGRDGQDVQNIFSEAFVSGFELDIDPTIVRYIHTLGDVYDNSKDLVISLNLPDSTLAASSAAAPVQQSSFLSTSTSTNSALSTMSPAKSSVVVWRIESKFKCDMSTCRFYPKSFVAKTPKSKFMDKDSNFAGIGSAEAASSGIDKFIIPGLSLWTSIQIPLGDVEEDLEIAGPRRIHAEVNVHSSQNALFPSLVPFLHDIVSGLKEGIRSRPRPTAQPLATVNLSSSNTGSGNTKLFMPQTTASSTLAAAEPVTMTTVRKHQEWAVTCYVCLEKTRIEFNCRPMAKVLSVLTFEQGSILMNYNGDRDGNRSTTLAGKFQGASSDTHHIFSPNKGFRLETKALTFNAVAESKVMPLFRADSVGGVAGASNRLASTPVDMYTSPPKLMGDVDSAISTAVTSRQNAKTFSIFLDVQEIGSEFDLRQTEILVLMKLIWMDQAEYLIRDGLTVGRSKSSPNGFDTSFGAYMDNMQRSPSPPPLNNINNNGSLLGLMTPSGSNKREPSFLGYDVFAIARLAQMRIIGDLGNQIGSMNFSLDEVRVRTKLRPFHPRRLSISTGRLDLQLPLMNKGWLEGYVVMEGVNLETLAKVSTTPHFPCCVLETVLETKPLSSVLSYDNKKVLIVNMEPMRFAYQDHWDGPLMERDVSHTIIGHLSGLRLIASAKTVPVFKSLFSKLTNMIEQKALAAKNELKRPLLSNAPSPALSGNGNMTPTTKDSVPNWTIPGYLTPLNGAPPETLTGTEGAGQMQPISVFDFGSKATKAWNAIGKVQISLGTVEASFFPFFFTDKDCTHAILNGIRVSLDRKMIYGESKLPVIHRLTELEVAGLSLQKYNLHALDIKTAGMPEFTLQNWLDRIRKTTSVATIAKLPLTTQLMESWQKVDDPVIEHLCRTVFEGLIDIATDYRLFRGLEKNIERFLEELRIRDFKDTKGLAEGEGQAQASNSAKAANGSPIPTTLTLAPSSSLPTHALPMVSTPVTHAAAAAIVAATAGPPTASSTANSVKHSSSTPVPEVSTTTATSSQPITGSMDSESPQTPTPGDQRVYSVPLARRNNIDLLVAGGQTSVLLEGPLSPPPPPLVAAAAAAGLAIPAPMASPAPSFNSHGFIEVKDMLSSPQNQHLKHEGAAHTGGNNNIIGAVTTTTPGSTSQPHQQPLVYIQSPQNSEGNITKDKPLIFKAQKEIVFNPALDILPNTPLPLGSLGFKKEDIPPIVHLITAALEEGLLTMAEFHAEKVESSGLQDLWEGNFRSN